MKKAITFISFWLITSIFTAGCAVGMVPNPNEITGFVPPGPDEVNFGPMGIEMPLGRMLLIRKDSKYYAVKFTKLWTEKDGKEQYATYEVEKGDRAKSLLLTLVIGGELLCCFFRNNMKVKSSIKI